MIIMWLCVALEFAASYACVWFAWTCPTAYKGIFIALATVTFALGVYLGRETWKLR
jgi:hypothetical protein